MTEIIKQETVEKINDDVIATNKHDAECYENAPVVEIPKADFDFYMQVFEKYETDKVKRAECQKRYFKNNKKSYYERQKKWRDGHKLDFNAKRRERYLANKINSPDVVLPSLSEEEVPVEVVEPSLLEAPSPPSEE